MSEWLPVCLSVCLSACLSICPSAWLFVCPSVCLCQSVCLSVCPSICLSLSVCLSVCLSARLSVSLSVSVHLPACPSVCLSVSVCLSICLSVNLSLCLSTLYGCMYNVHAIQPNTVLCSYLLLFLLPSLPPPSLPSSLSAKPNESMKLMLVGLQKMGKTTLLSRLREINEAQMVVSTFNERVKGEEGKASASRPKKKGGKKRQRQGERQGEGGV